MRENDKKRMRVLIVEDEEDILNLYTEYLSSRGHRVVSCSRNANNIVSNFVKCEPDICLIDDIVGGKSTGINAATQILEKRPPTPILFTTAYESIKTELPKHHDLDHKNIQVLLKPAKLFQIEDLMLDMVNN